MRSRLLAAVTAGACALAMSAPAVAPAAHVAKSKALVVLAIDLAQLDARAPHT